MMGRENERKGPSIVALCIKITAPWNALGALRIGVALYGAI